MLRCVPFVSGPDCRRVVSLQRRRRNERSGLRIGLWESREGDRDGDKGVAKIGPMDPFFSTIQLHKYPCLRMRTEIFVRIFTSTQYHCFCEERGNNDAKRRDLQTLIDKCPKRFPLFLESPILWIYRWVFFTLFFSSFLSSFTTFSPFTVLFWAIFTLHVVNERRTAHHAGHDSSGLDIAGNTMCAGAKFHNYHHHDASLLITCSAAKR